MACKQHLKKLKNYYVLKVLVAVLIDKSKKKFCQPSAERTKKLTSDE